MNERTPKKTKFWGGGGNSGVAGGNSVGGGWQGCFSGEVVKP